jgi:hypothetical protein
MNSDLTRKYFVGLTDIELSNLAEIYLKHGRLSQETVSEIQQYYLTTRISLDSNIEAKKMKLWSNNSQASSLAAKGLTEEILYRFSNQVGISMYEKERW